jgi:hypothetical protein
MWGRLDIPLVDDTQSRATWKSPRLRAVRAQSNWVSRLSDTYTYPATDNRTGTRQAVLEARPARRSQQAAVDDLDPLLGARSGRRDSRVSESSEQDEMFSGTRSMPSSRSTVS